MSQHGNFYPNYFISVTIEIHILKANHHLQTKQQIPTFYLEIHNIFMKFL